MGSRKQKSGELEATLGKVKERKSAMGLVACRSAQTTRPPSSVIFPGGHWPGLEVGVEELVEDGLPMDNERPIRLGIMR